MPVCSASSLTRDIPVRQIRDRTSGRKFWNNGGSGRREVRSKQFLHHCANWTGKQIIGGGGRRGGLIDPLDKKHRWQGGMRRWPRLAGSSDRDLNRISIDAQAEPYYLVIVRPMEKWSAPIKFTPRLFTPIVPRERIKARGREGKGGRAHTWVFVRMAPIYLRNVESYKIAVTQADRSLKY